MSVPSPKMAYLNLYCKGIALGTKILKGAPELPLMRFDLHVDSCGRGMTSQENGSLRSCQASVMRTPVTLAGRHSPDGLCARRTWVANMSHSFIAQNELGLESFHQGEAFSTGSWLPLQGIEKAKFGRQFSLGLKSQRLSVVGC